MDRLLSGMILVEKETENLNYYITTPYGPKIIDVDGFVQDFDPHNYERAYIPESYEDCWVPMESTIIEFDNKAQLIY